jgi:hypothetical protein
MDRVSIISLVVGSVLPLLTASVTKASWPEYAKQLLLAVLSAANGVGIALEKSGGVSATVIVANALTTFATAVAVSAGTWKPTGIVGRLEAMFIRDATAGAATVTSTTDTPTKIDAPSPTLPTPNSN